MGALVASLAHELNQPLTVIQMNTEMIDLILSSNESQLTQHQSIDKAMIGLKKQTSEQPLSSVACAICLETVANQYPVLISMI